MFNSPIFLKIRFQLLGALILAVGIPAIVGPNIAFWFPGSVKSQDNTIIATACAVLIGFYFLHRLINFPGVQASAYIIPTFVASYTAIILILLFTRLEYSRFQIGMSFALCIIWFYLNYFISNRLKPHLLAIVPKGAVASLHSLKSVEWHVLSKPELPGKVTGVVADLRADLGEDWERFIADCSVSGIPVFHVKQLQESITGKVEIEHLSENMLGSLLPNMAYMKLKQVMDLALTVILLPLLIPLFLLIAICIRILDGGPVLFVQERMGYRGIPFRLVKFRTMRNSDSGPSAAEDVKTRANDDRITPLGRWLRHTRLDELPQVFNIVRGQMSWIGPRPEAILLSKDYEAGLAFYRYRHVVRPGITGWAQVNQGHVSEMEDVNMKLHYDFYYIKNFSPWLDALIVLKTARIILTGQGAR